jgi:hypothetical protein
MLRSSGRRDAFGPRSARRQGGATLLVTLIMLVVLTLFVIAAVNLNTSNSKIVGNVQAKRLVDAVAQRAVDQVVNDNLFIDGRTTPVVPAWLPGGMSVSVTERVCKASTLTISDPNLATTIWEFDVCVSDSLTGARSYIRQGVSVKTLSAGTICPAPVAYAACTYTY